MKRNFLLTYDQPLLAPELQHRLSETIVGQRPTTHVLYIGKDAAAYASALSPLRYEGMEINSAFKAI